MRLALMMLGLAGCMSDHLTICGDIACPPGTLCDVAHRGCATAEQLAVCAGLDGVPCRTAMIGSGECDEGVCFPAGCGNTRLDADEVCDDGNNLEGDGCSSDCRSQETCGNGVVDPAVGEACDDGNTADGDGCQGDCLNPTCGDGVADSLFREECDDGAGNSNMPDGRCRKNCQLARCGDGVTDPTLGEICDDGNLLPGDGCRPDCASNETCGNGQLDFAQGEQCDDADLGSHDGCDSVCRVESFAWRLYQPRSPIQIEGGAAAYDEARRTAVFMGGYTYYSYVGLVEELVDGRLWRYPGGSGPNGRYHTAMAYDAARGVTILFGGADSFRTYGDTWSWDGKQWRVVGPLPTPTPRAGMAMAYDSARERIVMFGGTTTSDTLEWDGTKWTTIAVTGPTPSPRSNAAMAYDPVRGVIVLFGGSGSSGALAETWTWDGSEWTSHAVTGPQARASHAMSFDPRAGGIVMSGGNVYGADAQLLWKWDGSAWTAVGDDPAFARSGHVQYFDRALDATVVLRGGYNATDPTDARFVWDGTTVTPLVLASAQPDVLGGAVTYDQRRGQTVLFQAPDTWIFDGVEWTKKTTAHTPPARTGDGHMTYDSKRGVGVLFGGTYADASVWEWDGVDWTEYAVAGPTARIETQLAFDTTRGVTIVYSGYDTVTGPLTDLWAWDGTTWTPLPSSDGPGVRLDAALTYDEHRHVLVLFGGNDTNAERDDTWEWDGIWVEKQPAVTPPPRTVHGLDYDPVHRVVVLQGGNFFAGASYVALGDTWTWDGTQWQVLDAGSFGAFRQRLAYDRRANATVSTSNGIHLLRSTGSAVDEGCATAIDRDGDLLAGCADPDCWGYCSPSCPPGESCSSPLPYCGDGTCGAVENCRLCPGDCGACTAVCGDLQCDPGETAGSCPGDCS